MKGCFVLTTITLFFLKFGTGLSSPVDDHGKTFSFLLKFNFIRFKLKKYVYILT